MLPLIKSSFSLNPALYWFITGYFLFIPIFLFAILKVKKEGSGGLRGTLSALHIKAFSAKDWKYATIGLLLVFLFTGLIFGISLLLTENFGVRELSTTPWFMEIESFRGKEKLLLFVWLPMFFFNIVGEEILWRGYIQARLPGRNSWLFCSFFWWLFHLPFGADLLIMLLPAVIIVPLFFEKTKNTLVGIFIHGIYNGPIFVAVASGFIG